jgi:GrpB-like predicted nucleotidyltransferase (UPF0157 family)
VLAIRYNGYAFLLYPTVIIKGFRTVHKFLLWISLRSALKDNLTNHSNRPALIVVDYDPEWPQRYLTERAAVVDSTGNLLLKIEHMGSTSVPGLAAKPVIDMMAAVRTLDDGVRVGEILRTAGYHLIETGMKNRLLYRRDSPDGLRYHLHIVLNTGWDEQLERLLRNYLLKHPELAAEYGILKQQLAVQYADDSDSYTRAKTPFIQRVVDLARDEAGLPRVDVWEE